eukprot:TRINITY_DN11178_c0_g1_i3.p1 TRINITY_DN11178_c0_g1~~TRINITY_DN11178_c0_g1_i3.p1  ORF type:complete len:401 (-),score=75.96 TRINITY_DN11178_c0_g1_i3:75-1277(-)
MHTCAPLLAILLILRAEAGIQLLANPWTHPELCGGVAGHSSRVCDPVGFLSRAFRERLDSQLRNLENVSKAAAHDTGTGCGSVGPRGAQLAVALVGSLPRPVDVNAASRAVFNEWGIGHKECNNGVLFFLAINDRKSSIKTGQGAQLLVNDRMASSLLTDDSLKSLLRSGDYDAAVAHVVDQLEVPLASYTAPATYSFLGYWGGSIIAVLLVAATLLGMTWHSNKQAEKRALRKASFEAKLQRLQAARRLHKSRKGKHHKLPGVCAICLEAVADCDFDKSQIENGVEILTCGHCFHSTCIQSWLDLKASCPVCRHPNPRCSDTPEPRNTTEPGDSANPNHNPHGDSAVQDDPYWIFARSHLLSLIHITEPTRLLSISYAVFCLKKKKKHTYKRFLTQIIR